MVKERTITEIHDKEIGHEKFAMFVDEFINNGFTITNIKEYQTKYKFLLNDLPLEFDKNPIVSVWWQYSQCKNLYEQHEKLKKLKL